MLTSQPHTDGVQPGLFDLTEANAKGAEKKDNEANEEHEGVDSQDEAVDHDQIHADEDG